MPSFAGFLNMTRWFYNLVLHLLLPFVILRLFGGYSPETSPMLLPAI